MLPEREVYVYAKKYAVAWKHSKKYKDKSNHWTHKKLKYALEDLKNAALKLDCKDEL